jgi:hypothetical protein
MPASVRSLGGATGSTGVLKQYDSQAFANSDVIAAAPTTFTAATALNKGAVLLYLMFFDAAAVPANGAIPAMCPIALQPGGTGNLDQKQLALGLAMALGLCWAASTTPATLTVDATASVWVTANYSG